MQPVTIIPMPSMLEARFSGKKYVLPPDIQENVDEYWDSLMREGKTYTRGEVYTVSRKLVKEDSIRLLMDETDYAHYLYCRDVEDLEEHNIHLVSTASLVLTKDNKLIFGKMGDHTARAGILQTCGGGIDRSNLMEEILDLDHNMGSELLEEINIDVDDHRVVESFAPTHLKYGGRMDKMTAIYTTKLHITGSRFQNQYKEFTDDLQKNGETPEFGEIFLVENTVDAIRELVCRPEMFVAEFVVPLLEYLLNTHMCDDNGRVGL